jgi:hypothetical protein
LGGNRFEKEEETVGVEFSDPSNNAKVVSHANGIRNVSAGEV